MDSDNTNGGAHDDGMDLCFPMSEDDGSAPLLSPYTNRPCVEDDSARQFFWCGLCSTKLINTYCVIQHMKSNKHKRSAGLPVVAAKQLGHEIPSISDGGVGTTKSTESSLPHPNTVQDKEGSQNQGFRTTKSTGPSQPQPDPNSVQDKKNPHDRVFETTKLTEHSQPQSQSDPVQYEKNHPILDLKCLICDVSYDTLEAMEVHVKEEDHLNKLTEIMKPPNPRCDVCDMDFNSSITRDIHFKGKKHLNKVKVQGELQGTSGEKNGSSASISKDVPLSCKFCKVSFNGAVVATLHFKSRKHDNQMQLLGYPSTLDISGKRKHDGDTMSSSNKKFDGKGIDPVLENVTEEEVMSQWQSGNIGKPRPVGRGVRRARGRGRGNWGRGRGPSNPSVSGSNDPPALMNIPQFPANSFNQFSNNFSETNALGKVKHRDVSRGRPVFLPQNRHSHQQDLLTYQVNEIQNLQNRLEHLQSDMPNSTAYPIQY